MNRTFHYYYPQFKKLSYENMEIGQHIHHHYKICLQKLDSIKGNSFCHKVNNPLPIFQSSDSAVDSNGSGGKRFR